MPTRSDVLYALVGAMVEAGASARPLPDGSLPPDARRRIQSIAALAQEPALSDLTRELEVQEHSERALHFSDEWLKYLESGE